jgi:hypothetical protein
MAYNFPKDRIYSIKQAQKRLDLSDDELEQCLENVWLRVALPKTAIYSPKLGHFASLPSDQYEYFMAKPAERMDALQTLPEYLYCLNQSRPKGPAVFLNFSGKMFWLVMVTGYISGTVEVDAGEVAPGFRSQQVTLTSNPELQVNPVTLWELAQTLCGEESGFDLQEVIERDLVVPVEEIARFRQEYGVVSATRPKFFQASITLEEAFMSRKAEGTDPYLQEWAEHLAQTLMAGKSSAPTKLKIAEELLADERVVVKSVRALTLKPSTIAGLIRNTWDPNLTK